ncbi:hypothetical protein HUN92_13470 [Bacillus firmus]|uniref:hypothetical protein n=1 Tax=Cytobacillus firmus TaxID=1399 RepID=UPI00158099A6|nr:hypothetical protein [Cytobacillus firmus]NUH84729.1 hypothetical protein [Cytobacillus firmus]
MSESLQKASKRLFQFNKWVLKKRDDYLDNKVLKYRESFLKNNNRQPNEAEEKHYKKNLVMKMGIVIYLPIATILFILINTLRGI